MAQRCFRERAINSISSQGRLARPTTKMTDSQDPQTDPATAAERYDESCVSVIIPTYNRASKLELAIKSVVDTTSSAVEILICDDGSTDNSKKTVNSIHRSCNHRLEFIELEHSGLPAVARNAGIRVSNRPLLAFLDSDDIWLPGKLQSQLRHLNRSNDIVLSCTNAHRTTHADNESTSNLRLFHKPNSVAPRLSLAALIRSNSVITSSVLVKRKQLQSVGCFNESAEHRIGEDWHLWVRIAMTGILAYDQTPYVRYLDNPAQSIRGQFSRADSINPCLAALSDIQTTLRRNGRLDIEARKAVLEAGHNFCFQRLIALAEEQRWREFHLELIHLIARAPKKALSAALYAICSARNSSVESQTNRNAA